MERSVSSLMSISDFYSREVLSKLQLKRASEDGKVDKYELVQPVAHIGWIPPNGVLSCKNSISLPCMVLGMDNKVSSGEETTLHLRVTAAIYDPGLQQKAEDESFNYVPNFEGYRTLLNFLDSLEAATLKKRILADKYELASSIELKMYEEQPWPYWYGYLKFTVSCEAYPQTGYAKFLE